MSDKVFNEKFIDRNIAELCKNFDCIRGANVNIARITPDIIDGVKPVVRRALYCMYMKDQGKIYRKVATISGDTFGKLHPHCLTGDTKFLVYGRGLVSLKKMAEEKGTYKTLSFNMDHDAVMMSTISNVRITREVNQYMIITFGHGSVITCTDDHQILVVENNVALWKPAKNIKVGDTLYGSSNVRYENDTTVDVINSLYPKVTDISIKAFPSVKIPMYDFTSDTDQNAMVFCHSKTNNSIATAIVHNSPVAIEDAIVNVAQPWHIGIPLIDINGNAGSVAGDPAGASRYIRAKISDYAQACFFEDWKDSVVDYTIGADEETKEPLFLPAKYPNVLIGGCLGIGYGMACNIIAYNFKEVIDATILLMTNPNAHIVLIPDSPSGCDIIESDFGKVCELGVGSYSMRCKYEIDANRNMIKITALPHQIDSNDIRAKIAEVKEKNGLSELIKMDDLSGEKVDIELTIRDDVNPYKFMKKLIKTIPGLEKTYPVNITLTNGLRNFDLPIRDVLLEWIKYRREQKRVVMSHKRARLLSDQRINDTKIFLMTGNNLHDTVEIFKSSHNRAEIESRLIERYHNSSIHMDSLTARTLSNMRMVELSLDAYNEYLVRQKEIAKELASVEETLKTENGIDKLIIAELRDGAKRFGHPRRSNVVPKELKMSLEVEGSCILQLSSDGMIIRRLATNVDEEPVPTDSNGFAVKVDNDSSFILIDDTGHHAFIKANEIPLDTEVPVNRYSKQNIDGNVVAMLPSDIESNLCCTLISKFGQLKRFRIADLGPSKKPIMALDSNDRIVKGVITAEKTSKDLLIYTNNGMGQRLDPNQLRITSPSAKGGNAFKLNGDDEIVGVYVINPKENAYLLYVTSKGKMRLNNIEYLPTRESKHDSMVQLIILNDRDKLVSVLGCNKLDKVTVYFDDSSSEVIDISTMPESTMSSEPKKMTNKNAVSNNIIKARIC